MDILQAKMFVTLKTINREEKLFDMIERSIENSHSDYHEKISIKVEEVFSIQKSSEDLRFMVYE